MAWGPWLALVLLCTASMGAASSAGEAAFSLDEGGWASWLVEVPANYSLTLSVEGELLANGAVGVGFATGAVPGEIQNVYTRILESEGLVEIDIASSVTGNVQVNTESSGSYFRHDLILSCEGCPPARTVLVAYAAGDTDGLTFSIAPEETTVLGEASGVEAWYYASADMGGHLAGQVSAGSVPLHAAVHSKRSLVAPAPAVGLYWPGMLQLESKMTTPDSIEVCPCWAKADHPPGEYSFILTKAGLDDSIILFAAPELFRELRAE